MNDPVFFLHLKRHDGPAAIALVRADEIVAVLPSGEGSLLILRNDARVSVLDTPAEIVDKLISGTAAREME